MRVLLAHNSLYYPAHGGGDKSNRLLMEALAGLGHQCRVVARLADFEERTNLAFLAAMEQRGVAVQEPQPGFANFSLAGVDVHVATTNSQIRAYFANQIETFAPDVILCSTDDPAQLLLGAALQSGRKVVYLARATLALPFGPDCAFPSTQKTDVLRQVDAFVGVSQYVADYTRQWSGIPAVHVPISLMDAGPYPESGSIDNEFVTLVNPCRVKGISIFADLAERMPEVKFAAVPTWGTNESDFAELRQHANVTILEPVDDIDLLLRRTRVLLVPSLWAEARSRIIVEAMLRGIPVIASAVGGIPEAKMGVDYLIPVRPIEHYAARVDENMVPVAEVPPQDIAPWETALRRLVTDRAHYSEISRASRSAALAYAASATIHPFAALLESSRQSGVKHAGPAGAALSPEKRALLALRARKLAATGNTWFTNIQADAEARLFCFPYAGGGALAFRGWAQQFPKSLHVCPVRLPSYPDMESLTAALAEAIVPFMDRPSLFFGHSMGAAIAFELCRQLRKAGHALPSHLFVSGARAAQFRRDHQPGPAPTDAELVEQLRRLEGTSEEMLASPDAWKHFLPALRADAELYRQYIYHPEPPLPIPITAYGGLSDPNIEPSKIEAWREQTSVGFQLKLFPGGHFFINSLRIEFLQTLIEDCRRALP